MRDTRRGYRDYCGVDGRAGIGERSRVGRGEGEDAAGGDDHRAGAGRGRARPAGTLRAVPPRRGGDAATPAARTRPHSDTGHAGLSLPHLFDHLSGAVPSRVSRPRLCAPMHLVARDREPPERHGPHPADALLVAAGRLSALTAGFLRAPYVTSSPRRSRRARLTSISATRARRRSGRRSPPPPPSAAPPG